MCILCGELVLGLHWTENLEATSATVKVGHTQQKRLRDRLKRVRLANDLLVLYGLSLRDWQGSKYLLSDKKGRSVLVQHLGELWAKAEELLDSRIDILDPALLARLEANG